MHIFASCLIAELQQNHATAEFLSFYVTVELPGEIFKTYQCQTECTTLSWGGTQASDFFRASRGFQGATKKQQQNPNQHEETTPRH